MIRYSNGYAALGEQTNARIFLDDRVEFERRREAGTSMEASVLA